MGDARRAAAAAAVAIGCNLASPSLAADAGDSSAGKQVFARCAGCHSINPGTNGVGPSLAGVVGRKAATESGYGYSPALKGANLTWDERTLDNYLEAPGALVHGTKMFINVPSTTDRANVIAYLSTLSAPPHGASAGDK
jgi:cytochrome c